MSQQLSVPFALDKTGKVAAVESRDQQMSQRVRAVVATGLSERVMRPDFGTDLGPFLFEINDSTTRQAIRHTVQDSLSRWEPNAIIKGIEPLVKDEAQGVADVYVDIGRSNTDPEATDGMEDNIVVRPGGRVDIY
ncbi:GPW/gp25 family protein [Streptomyces sp. UNOC14_S4]|uniref:GPW/gp25 family protein n=1 Tax=Streptomyces sp. UNOC14_S4 TaxID=2872340 RepID=UPI001E3ECF95|nr:GPW/gp25 family protein [Streptomyces sp. UNOC14_S4]MCC3766034.1 GPW/gp25 family protein [Streptomyces sp. UNOC14_S4]